MLIGACLKALTNTFMVHFFNMGQIPKCVPVFKWENLVTLYVA